MMGEVGHGPRAGIGRESGKLQPSGECLPENQQQFSAVLNRI